MKTQNIERNQWESFMDEFSRRHDGWLASIEVEDDTGQRRFIAERLPFEGISAEVGVGGRDYVNIRVGRDQADSIMHRIASPRRIQFVQSEEGTHAGVQIDAGDQGRTIVRFDAPASSGPPEQAPVL